MFPGTSATGCYCLQDGNQPVLVPSLAISRLFRFNFGLVCVPMVNGGKVIQLIDIVQVVALVVSIQSATKSTCRILLCQYVETLEYPTFKWEKTLQIARSFPGQRSTETCIFS